MHLYTSDQVQEFNSQNNGDGACYTLVMKAARDAVGTAAGTDKLHMLSMSTINLSPLEGGAIEAQADLLTSTGTAALSCRVTLTQDQTGPARKVTLSETMLTFTADKPVEAVPAEVPKKRKRAKSGLSETAEERRKQIFEGACRVISKHGFGNASMREIAREAGLSVPLMYKYIKDKDDILYLITTMSMQDIIDYFDTEELLSGPADQNLMKAVDKYIDYIGVNRRYINLVYSETRSLSPENRARVFDMERSFMKRWQAILDQGVDQGSFRSMNTELMANYLYFLCTVWSLRYWSVGQFGEEEVRESLKAFVHEGVRLGGTEL